MPILANLPPAGNIWLAGDTHQFEVIPTEEGEPLVLTPFDEAVFTAKISEDDSDNAPTTIQKTLGAGVEFEDAVNGIIVVTIDPEDTTDLEEDTTYSFDLQLRDTTDGETITVAKGKMTFTRDITQI
jgi:hypothetical protein